MNADLIEQYLVASRWHSKLWYNVLTFCEQTYVSPTNCPGVAAAFVSLMDEYRALALQLEFEPWETDLTTEISSLLESWPPGDARASLLEQPALVAKRVLKGWNPREVYARERTDYAEYYTYKINQSLAEVQYPLHRKGRGRSHRDWGSEGTGSTKPPGGDPRAQEEPVLLEASGRRPYTGIPHATDGGSPVGGLSFASPP